MFRRSTLSINSRLCLHRLVSTGAPKGRPRRVSVGESAPPSPPADEPVKRPRARRSKDPPKEPKKEPRSRKQASPVLEHTNVVDEALEDEGVGNILAAREHETGVKANQDLPRHPMGLDGLLNNPLAPDWTTRPSVDPPTPSAVPPLPPLSQWKSIFPVQVHNQVFLRERVSIKNPRSARMIAESFVPNGLRDQVIIEAFPGIALYILVPEIVSDIPAARAWCCHSCTTQIAQRTHQEAYSTRGLAHFSRSSPGTSLPTPSIPELILPL